MKALVVRGPHERPRVEDVEPPVPGPTDVRVRILAAGICHSDLSMFNGTLSPSYPLVLGHEAAGAVVEADAAGTVRVGDRVVVNWAPACRACWFCTRGEPWLCEATGAPSAPGGTTIDGVPLHRTLGVGALAEEVVIPASAAIPVPPELPASTAALLGCAVATGTGAVRRTAGVARGESVAVIGLGGLGLAVVIAARAAGADPIIAIDVSPAKGDLAGAAGATHVLVSDTTLSRAVRELTGGRGADHAVECVGLSGTIQAAWRMTRRGGTVTVIGVGARDDEVRLGALDIFHSARTLRSSVFGSSDPDRDVPALAAEVLAGALDLSPLITDRIPLDGAPEAFDRMARGEGARSVVVLE